MATLHGCASFMMAAERFDPTEEVVAAGFLVRDSGVQNLADLAGDVCELGIPPISSQAGERLTAERSRLHFVEPANLVPGAGAHDHRHYGQPFRGPSLQEAGDLFAADEF